MQEVHLRSARPDDAGAMSACATAAYSRYLARMDRPPAPMLADYESEIRHHAAFVLEAGDRIVGLLVLHDDDTALLLDNVAVLPEFQGLGLGRRLLVFAEEEARRLGYREIRLCTNEVMTENIQLYQRLGYVEYERVLDKGYHRVYMRKALRKPFQ